MSTSQGTSSGHTTAPLAEGLLVEGALGYGRLLELEGGRALIEYFDRPGVEGLVRRIEDPRHVRRAVLAPQTRVHWRRDAVWEHGRVIEHDRIDSQVVVRRSKGLESIVPESKLVVRWRQRLRNATALLADGWVESRRFHDARHAFVEAYLGRGAAHLCLSAISSAAIEAHPHQIEAIRRVVTDPQPRYLLADEVGLGKTIEAGLVVRQFLLDRQDTRVLVVVPEALTYQWRRELDTKFAISEQFSGRCEVVSHEEFGQGGFAGPELLVVDEAHQLTKTANQGYERLREAAIRSPGVLLLSATPLLQEPASLLRMLHLLSPDVHPLDDLETFEKAIASREEVAALYGNLSDTAQPVFLSAAVSGLRAAFPGDRRLIELLDGVEAAAKSEGPEVVAAAVRRARSHVAEVHRLHNRMIRTRRGVGLAEDFPVLGRIAPHFERVSNSLDDVIDAYSVWREFLLAKAEAQPESADTLVAGALPVVAALSLGGAGLVDAVEVRLRVARPAVDAEEAELLADLADAARIRAAACPRVRVAVRIVTALVLAGERVAVAASTEELAAEIAAALVATATPTRRITHELPDAARWFAEAPTGAVLVFGPLGEEGQNLQAATKVVHVDIPWDANRLEQRLGRFDRFGAGMPCDHLVLMDDADSPGNAWVDLLRDGFGIFSGSIASLQLAIERLAHRIHSAAVLQPPNTVRDLAPWVTEELEQELGAVELTELLDETALDDRGREFIDAVEHADRSAPTTAWAEAVIRWASGGPDGSADLRFHHTEEAGRHTFAMTRFENPDITRLRDTELPLVAWGDLANRFAGSMLEGKVEGTFRRNSASQRGLRLLGPGDPFIDALWDFTEVDDRGRAYGLWRARPFWKHDEALFACFDVRIRPDITGAIAATGLEPTLVEAALRRKAESYFPAMTERVWLTLAGRPVTHDGLLQLLEAPYADRRGDQTLRPAMWERLDVHVPRSSWAAWCSSQQQHALSLVADRTDVTNRCQAGARQVAEDADDHVARLIARGGRRAVAAAEQAAAVGRSLAAGLQDPDYEVDAVGIVVLSSSPLSGESPE